jgi:hypothetical protein
VAAGRSGEGGADEDELSPVQKRSLGRVQLVGVLLIIATSLLASLVRTSTMIVGSLAGMVVGILVLGWLAARVQRRPFRELAWEATTGVVADMLEKRQEWAHRFGHRE